MKRKGKLLICIGVVLVLAAGGVIAYPHLFPKEKEIVEVGVVVCYASAYPEDLYEDGDLVIKGIYNGDESYYVHPDLGLPQTIGTVTVTELLKGACGDTVKISFRGGEIPMLESLKIQHDHLSEEELLAANPGAENQMMKWKGIDPPDTVDAREGQAYIFFLFQNEAQDCYGVGAQAYGMRPLNDKGQALNPDTGEYETLLFLTETEEISKAE